MRQRIGTILVFLCLALLVYDGASRRMSTFMPLRSEGELNARLVEACEVGDVDEVGRLLRWGADADASVYGWRPLEHAAELNRADVAALLVRYGASVHTSDTFGNTALDVATAHLSKRVVAFLLGVGAEPTLHAMVLLGDAHRVDALLAEGASPNGRIVEGLQPLHLAVRAQHSGLVERLLARGAHVDGRDNQGLTPLHDAACAGDARCARLLLDHSADANAVEEDQRKTPLHCAAEAGSIETVQLLIERGAAVDGQDQGGLTPLHGAAFMNHEPVVGLLLDAGARPNARDPRGETALFKAVVAASAEAAACLVERGADPNLPDLRGRTPLDVALYRGDADLAQLLKTHGAKAAAELGREIAPADGLPRPR